MYICTYNTGAHFFAVYPKSGECEIKNAASVLYFLFFSFRFFFFSIIFSSFFSFHTCIVPQKYRYLR